MTAGLFFCPESQKIRDQDSLEQQEVVSSEYVTAKKDLTFLFNNICYNRIVTGNEMIGEHYE